MNCESIKRLIHLYREGELTRREQAGLKKHLDRCAACSEKAAAVAGDLERVRARISAQPEVPDPDGLTAGIMTGVRAVDRITNGRRGALPRLFPSPYPWLQPALGTVALAVVTLLLVQEAVILTRVMRLEERIARYGVAPTETVVPGLAGNIERGIDWLEEVAARGERGFPVPAGNEEWVIVRQSDLMDVLSDLAVGEADRISIERLLRDLIPELRMISLENGLSRGELRSLLEHRTEIVNALRQL